MKDSNNNEGHPNDQYNNTEVSSEVTVRNEEDSVKETVSHHVCPNDCCLSELVDEFPELEDISWSHRLYSPDELNDEIQGHTSYDPDDIRELIDEVCHGRWNYTFDSEG